ncbi:hypothetical protein FB565_004833 [Actinoplanes lutulentus]|uniref:Uncharacterized protein n=1 Tax=Actinoplanes lutulentus TaxID=1287878 RepID=A0A327Z5M2_9ACTN|nr:DUF6232 family protein [Actinoplanes lutulentus]MBB2945100.1 hypothetical protein [Actinoplanes lutulentus]RAK31896.1 hypothetical protein B0I29_114146 [Actinoplanes lutulentus]
MRTRTYYSGPDAMVTDDQFVWITVSNQHTFTVRDLRNVGLVQAPSRMRPFAPALAVGVLFAAVAGWSLMTSPTWYVAGFVAVSAPAVVAIWRKPRHWELHAQYRNQAVVLYSSADARVFNQVSRALRRAMEDTGRTPWGYGLAAA